MIIKKDNGKVKMELTDDELIIKGIFKDTKIKRGNIRSAVLEENRFSILTYDDKVIFRNHTNSSSNYKEQLKLLVDEINKENIIFSASTVANYSLVYSSMYTIFVVFVPLSHKIPNKTLESIVFLGGSILYMASIILVCSRANNVLGMVYNIDRKEFKIIGMLGGIKEKFAIDNVEFVKNTFRGNMYRSKKTGSKFYLQNDVNPIKYPSIHSEEIKSIENIVIDK